MSAGELHGDLVARPKRDVRERDARDFFDLADEHLVRILRRRARHRHAPAAKTRRVKKRSDIRIGRVAFDPQKEFVECDHRDGTEVGQRVADGRGQRLQPHVVRREDHLMRIARGAPRVDERLGARSAAFVRHDNRPTDEAIFLQDGLDDTGELIAATAGAGGDDELNGPRRLPRAIGWRRTRCARHEGCRPREASVFHEAKTLPRSRLGPPGQVGYGQVRSEKPEVRS